jgi:hypothetical protein
VASPVTARLGWPLAAALAFAFLAGFALHGKRPEAGLADFKPGGFLTQFAPEDAAEVEVATPNGRRTFRRSDGWPPRIDEALRLLRDSAPLRTMGMDEISTQPASSYGLDDHATRVAVRNAGGRTFVIRFGGRNPLGSGRYAAVEGVPGVSILPTYVGDAWEQVLK